MSDPEELQEWVAKAEEDYAGAVDLHRRRKAPLPNLVCFHAQQCAEKYMKALLLSKGADFPKTHDLLMLNNLCSAVGIFVEIDPKLLNTLTDYAVRTRYPGEGSTLGDAKEAMEITKSIRSFARRFLGS